MNYVQKPRIDETRKSASPVAFALLPNGRLSDISQFESGLVEDGKCPCCGVDIGTALLTRLAGCYVQQAYRGWLLAYIDNTINLSRFANPPVTAELSSLLERIGGMALP